MCVLMCNHTIYVALETYRLTDDAGKILLLNKEWLNHLAIIKEKTLLRLKQDRHFFFFVRNLKWGQIADAIEL